MSYNKEKIRDKFEELFENSLDLIYVHDLKGNFLDANEITLERLGYKREEIPDISFKDLVSKDQIPLAFKALTEIRDSGKQITPTEYKLKTKNGEFVYVETYGIPLREDGKFFGILGVARDITALKLTEQKLMEAKERLLKLNKELEQRIKKRTKNLKTSEERYRHLFEKSPNSIVLMDMQGKILDCNSSVEKIYGYKRGDLISKTFMEISLVPAEIFPVIMKKFKFLLKNEIPEPLEIQIYKKDRSLIWINAQASLIKLRKNILIQLIIEDIHERKEAEQALKDSEEKYRLISENANDLIAIVNQKSKFEYINEDIHTKLLGFSKDDLIGKSTLEIIHPEDVEKAVESFRKGFELGELMDIVRIKDKKSVYHWFEVRGKIFTDQYENKKILMIARDITERKKAEKELKESEQKYRSILENIEEGYFELDLKGNYTFVNDYHISFYGITKGEMIGKSYRDFVDKKYIKMLFKTFHQVYREEVPNARFEVEATRNDGVKGVFEGTCNLKFDSNGKKIGFYSLTRDITERKKAEKLREKFTEQLENEVKLRTKELNETLQQQKLYLDQILKASQFKTEFMATMSHELRTPLNAIIGFSDLLLEGSYGPLKEVQLDFLQDIETSANDLLEMITHILDISKIEAGQLTLNLQEFSLNTLINQIDSTLKPIYTKKGLTFKVVNMETKKMIYADPVKLKEILYNLLNNAIKFTIEGMITLKILEKEDYWEFNVIDTGIGIAKKDYDLIFKDFSRVSSPYVLSTPGTGLGLSLNKRLINLHGGEIYFTSELGKGSTFTFTIPKALKANNIIHEVSKLK